MATQPSGADKPSRRPVQRMPTRLESADEIRVALQAHQADLLAQAGLAAVPVVPATTTAPDSPPPAAKAPPAPVPLFRPTQRPPLALLCVFDDGGTDGEWFRLRGDRFVIGRAEGDLVLGHDAQISSRHAELVRQRTEEGGWEWLLTDLGSTNGTFVRVGNALIKDGQEFLVGRTHYRFEAAPPAPPAATQVQPLDVNAPLGAAARATASWIQLGDRQPVPTLVELTPAGPGLRVPLTQSEYWIGSDARSCPVVPPNDPYVGPWHARVYRDSKGRWHVANSKSVNGVWVRVEQMPLTGSCQFQLGEQRFLFRVP
jgi:pSer/pThr/pTyr-binding forkhead associated (FHA) protein